MTNWQRCNAIERYPEKSVAHGCSLERGFPYLPSSSISRIERPLNQFLEWFPRVERSAVKVVLEDCLFVPENAIELGA